ncbi:sensor histidine kinase [Paenibacillus mendelii]|uniref:Histidine kinase n=1 Tax=Paenibacillus mendelii TaxID=206163 RepID=A0ABV6JM00_9BACL|nr:histidine kinase [Paenibacillus mendelii]MCQ6562281.1 sensor histidine kinase [Paenibacillus mendelii]
MKRRMRFNFHHLHLKHKLLICYGTLIVFSVLIVGVFSYYNAREYVSGQASDEYFRTLEQIRMNIEFKLNTYDELANQIITDDNFIFALFKTYTSPADYSYQYLTVIRDALKLKEKNKSVLDMLIYKENDTMPEDGVNLINLESAQKSWWYKTYFGDVEGAGVTDFIRMQNAKVWLITDEDLRPPYKLERVARQKRVAIVKPIVFNRETLVGILETDIKYDAIFGEYEAARSGGGAGDNDDRLFITDAGNSVLFQNDEGGTATAGLLRDYASEMEGKSGGFFQIDDGKAKKLIVFSKGTDYGWTYFREIPIERLLNSAKSVQQLTIAIALLSIAVSFLISLVIASVLTRRIAVLSRKMEEIGDLELDVTVEIDGKDEVGHLARSFNRMIKRMKELVTELKSSQQIQRDSEVKALQAQINPHFLYNTLATIKWAALDNESDKVATMVDNLSTFYRLSLNKGREFLTVEEELEQITAYTDIQQERLGERIRVQIDCEEEIKRCYMLKLLLQPFVENAIIHGAEHNYDSVTTIRIHGFRAGERIVLEVIDDGIGIEHTPSPGDYRFAGGYGILNVHEKIRIVYGGQYGVGLTSERGWGTKVTVTIPVVVDDPNPADS